MRRDKNLLRLLLQRQRDGEDPSGLADYPESDRIFHAALLVEEGFAKGIVRRDAVGQFNGAVMLNLTTKGYDYLDALEIEADTTRSRQGELPMKRDKELMRLLLQEVRDGETPSVLSEYSERDKLYNAALLIEADYVDGSTLRDHTGQLCNAFINHLTSKGHDFLEQLEASNRQTAEMSAPMTLSIFLSHASKDVAIAEALIEFFRSALNLSNDKIRCTSVSGYRLPGGASTDETLKFEVKASKAFVGLITPNSMKSAYVLFELGARWGAGLPFVPLLARGADASLLKGPLSGINALSCASEEDMHQLVGELGKTLGIQPSGPAAYNKHLRMLVEAAAMKDVTDCAEHVPVAQSQEYPPFTDAVMRFAAGSGGSFYPEGLAKKERISEFKAQHYGETLEELGLLDSGRDQGESLYFLLTQQGRAYVVKRGLDEQH